MTEQVVGKNVLTAWDIGTDTKGQPAVIAFHDDYEGVRVVLQYPGHCVMLQVRFPEPVAYLRTMETNRNMTWGKQNERGGPYTDGFYIVENSTFIDWIWHEGAAIIGDLVHYAIYTIDICFDIVLQSDDEVRFHLALTGFEEAEYTDQDLQSRVGVRYLGSAGLRKQNSADARFRHAQLR